MATNKSETGTNAPFTSTSTNSDLDWLKGLQSFIFNDLLSMTGTTVEDRIKLVEADVMPTWQLAFTHITYDRNPQNNYEVIEHFGDAVMDLSFADYLSKKFPGITVAQVNNLKVIYLSKKEQSRISFQYGLTKWVRSKVDVSIHVAEDILEAFFGALFLIGDKKLGPGSGFVISFNLLVNILKPINIQLTWAKIHPKTKLSEIYAKLQWGPLKDYMTQYKPDISSDSQTGYTITIRLSEKAFHDLRELGLSLPRSGIIARGEGKFLDVLEFETVISALQLLESYGITWEWANEISELRHTRLPQIAPYFHEANSKAKKEGYKRIFFPKVEKKITSEDNMAYSFIQLIGEKPNSELVNLSTAEGTGNVDSLKIQAFRNYVNS